MNTKRIIAALLALVLCLSLCACGGKSDAVIAVETAIENLGEITVDSDAAITQVEEMYNALSEEEKAQVENAPRLTMARKDFNTLVADRCIPGTTIEFPEKVLDIPNKGAWVVDDRDDFTAYNLWPETESYAKQGFEAYKEYVAARTEITEVDSKCFTFQADNGTEISIYLHIHSNSSTIQVRVPKQ